MQDFAQALRIQYELKMNVDPVKNIAADVTSFTLQWIDKGFDLIKVPDGVQQARIRICENCPDKKFEEKDRRCTECSCPNMDFKTSLKYDPIKSGIIARKVLITCPLKHW